MPKRRINKRHVLIVRWSVPCILGGAALTVLLYVASLRADPAAANPDGSIDGLTSVLERRVPEGMIRFQFADVASAAGIEFQHFPDTRASLLPEDMGSGAAWGDYDDDGDPDLFLVNFRGSLRSHATEIADAAMCRLYRNAGNGTFEDASELAGLALVVNGLAAEWGDYDNDDDLDLYVTCYGPNVLMRNNGDGSFTDVSTQAAVDDPSFSAGCSWADFDRDGLLDLYVCNYVEFDERAIAEGNKLSRQYDAEIPFTINPSSYPPTPNRLYHNNGDGTFTDVAKERGVGNPTGRSLEAAWFDFDNDGWIDLYVANDISANGVFRSRGDGTFEDIGASSLAADYRGAMGLAVSDADHDGDSDLFVTHWLAQENAYFENMWAQNVKNSEGTRKLFFIDEGEMLGLGHISLKTVGWATGFADFDNDRHADLWVVNGNTLEHADDHTKLKPQQMHLFARDGDRGFFEVARWACPPLAEPMVGRGGAAADFDGDGLLDLIIQRHAASPLLLRNTSDNENHWLRLDLRQTGGNTRAVGARVEIFANALYSTAQVGASASYLSQDELTLHFGLGAATSIDRIVLHWPDGASDTHSNIPVNQTLRFTHDARYKTRPLTRSAATNTSVESTHPHTPSTP